MTGKLAAISVTVNRRSNNNDVRRSILHHHKPPPEFETIGGENDEKQANHRKPLQTTTRIRVKKESNCQFCGLNLVMARRNIIYLCHSCCLHDFSICKQLLYIEKHWHVCNNQYWLCVAPPIEYAWCQFKMTSSKCPYRSKHQVIILTVYISPSWQEGGFARRTPLNFRGVGGAAVQHPPEATPGMYFEMFWTVAMWLHLVTETNRYADQDRQRKPPPPSAPIWMPVTVREMKAFVGLCFAMGVLPLPSRNDYWRQTKWFLKTEFGKVMSRDRFNLIWRYLHLTNNDIPAAIGDKLSKVRWYIDFLNNQFQTMYVPYGKYAVDESMIRFKGRLAFRQYMPAKPIKWGVKIWALAESSTGYLSKFQVYTGRAPEGQGRGLTFRVVTDLVDQLYGQLLHQHRPSDVSACSTSVCLWNSP